MTATLPPSVIEFFQKFCGLVKIEASQEDIEQRDDWRKVYLQLERAKDNDKFVWSEKDQKSLAEFVWERWHDWENLGVDGPQKVIVFVNTVDRAIRVYDELKNFSQNQNGPKVILAHSRFTRDDRKNVEDELSQRFGKTANPSPAILVTTQVAEAGLNISAPLVITELCPMDSLIQRAGRCQRFKPDGNQELRGKVIVVKPAGDNWYIPYVDRVRLVRVVTKVKQGKEKEERTASNVFPAIELTQAVLEEKVSDGEILLDWEMEQEFIKNALDRLYNAYLSGTTDVEFSESEKPHSLLYERHKPSKRKTEEVEEEPETEEEE